MPSIIDVLLPPACAACGRGGHVLCRECRDSFAPTDPGAFVVADAGIALGDALALAVGAFAYRGALRRALGRLKYAGAGRVAQPLGSAAAPTLARLLEISGPVATLVPVPIHPVRERQRGYNQAALLARELARGCDVPLVHVLERRTATERQHRLDRAARLRNLRDAIRVKAGSDVPPIAIVVDDILTTAATLEACASVLRGGGAREVYGFAVAREV